MPILMYHHVNRSPPASELEARLTTTDADFARQLGYLRCAGYYSITLSQLFDGIYGGAPLPEKPVILTFDDGYADAYTNAFVQLNRAGFGGTFSIVTGWVGQPGYLTWDQIREMTGVGMEMVAHSVSHPDLGVEPDNVVRDQLNRSKRELEENLGQPVAFFVYPSGEPFRYGTKERQAQVVSMLQEAGYRGALTATWNLAQDPAAPFALNRVRVSGGIEIKTFAENMGGPAPEAIGC
jgi:peptidoglycan/xylan/chitin deacetylase (PgdA/CDA1 family)